MTDSEPTILNELNSTSRYRGLPIVFISYPDGTTRPAPFLMGREDLAAFMRLHDSNTKFPNATIDRYRKENGLRSIRVGRRTWFSLPDVLDFFDRHQVLTETLMRQRAGQCEDEQ